MVTALIAEGDGRVHNQGLMAQLTALGSQVVTHRLEQQIGGILAQNFMDDFRHLSH